MGRAVSAIPRANGGEFSDDQACDGVDRGQGPAFGQGDPVNEQHGAHPRQLLRQMGGGRDAGPLQAVVIAADAGMAGAEGHGDGQQAQQGGAARILEQAGRDQICARVQEQHGQKGEGQGEKKAHVQDRAGFFQVPFSGFTGYEPRDGDLGACGGERIADPVDGKDHLVDAEALGTDGAA